MHVSDKKDQSVGFIIPEHKHFWLKDCSFLLKLRTCKVSFVFSSSGCHSSVQPFNVLARKLSFKRSSKRQLRYLSTVEVWILLTRLFDTNVCVVLPHRHWTAVSLPSLGTKHVPSFVWDIDSIFHFILLLHCSYHLLRDIDSCIVTGHWTRCQTNCRHTLPEIRKKKKKLIIIDGSMTKRYSGFTSTEGFNQLLPLIVLMLRAVLELLDVYLGQTLR